MSTIIFVSKLAEYSLKRKLSSYKSLVSGTVSGCYSHFFDNGQPPTGFGKNDVNIRYICQTYGDPTYLYATMFDLSYGIPIYSAYYVTPKQAGQFGSVKRTGSWHQEKGIVSKV